MAIGGVHWHHLESTGIHWDRLETISCMLKSMVDMIVMNNDVSDETKCCLK